jgi:hypothetical protein
MTSLGIHGHVTGAGAHHAITTLLTPFTLICYYLHCAYVSLQAITSLGIHGHVTGAGAADHFHFSRYHTIHTFELHDYIT